MTKTERQTEALTRATNGQSLSNYPAIIEGFAARGITATPRVDVFSYHAWQKLGRQVQRGEHGVKIVTWIDCKGKRDPVTGEPGDGYRRPRSVSVFHVSQTEAIQ